MPTVSVIIPAFNAEQYVHQAIQSVRSQTYKDWELIVVNDGSTDSTASVVDDFRRRDSRIQMITQVNGRLAKARNAGLGVATGDFLAFLDADDVWLPQKLEQQMRTQASSDADIVFTDAFHFPEGDSNLATHLFGGISGLLPAPKMFERLYRGNAIPVSSVLLHRSASVQTVRFDESADIRGVEDYELWLRLSSNGASFFGMNERLVGYRTHPEQMSGKTTSMMLSTLAVRHLYVESARHAGINVADQELRDHRDLAYCSANEGNFDVAWSTIGKLTNVRRFGFRGCIAAAGATLHALFHSFKR